jgi:hypothetical protein
MNNRTTCVLHTQRKNRQALSKNLKSNNPFLILKKNAYLSIFKPGLDRNINRGFLNDDQLLAVVVVVYPVEVGVGGGNEGAWLELWRLRPLLLARIPTDRPDNAHLLG